MPRFPDAASTATTLSDRVFSQLVSKAKSQPGPIFPLHVGDTYRDPPVASRAEAQRSHQHHRLHNYSPVQGEPRLIAAVAQHLRRRGDRAVDPNNIQIMAGATSGLSIVCETILEPGDEVLLPSPYWPLIRGIIAGRGAKAVEIPFWDRMADGDFDVEAALGGAITDRTVALYLNSPSNPTGQVISEDVQKALGRLAAKHNLWVICDEAYEEIYFTDAPLAPIWAREDFVERAIACHSFSKGYGLAGARVGFTHGPTEIMQAIRGVQTFQTYCASRPMQLGALGALREGGPWLNESRRLYREAGARAADTLGVARPMGGTFVFFDARPYLQPNETVLSFLERCLQAGVLLTPGSACGSDYADWVRLCFTSVAPAELDEALRRLQPLVAKPR